MNQLMRTIVLKLHNPSGRKKSIIDEALVNYSKAFQYLLDKANSSLGEIERGYEQAVNGTYFIEKWIAKDIDKELNIFSIEPFKDSLKMDFAAVLSGYFALKKKGHAATYPVAFPSAEEFKLRPIYFCRYSKKRNYSLLFDKEKEKFFAKLFLMNGKNEKRQNLLRQENKNLVYMDEAKSPFEQKDRKKCYELFPLAFGKYQEEYLNQALKNPHIIKTARLFKKNTEYFLAVSLSIEKTKAITVENYMGISRGIENVVNYAVIDKEGKVICSGVEKIENTPLTEARLHKITNRLTEIANINKAQIVMEKLINGGDGLTFRDKEGKTYIPNMNLKSYNLLIDKLNYKALAKGLPKIIMVSGFGIFNTCPYCSANFKANRFSSSLLICTSCGRTSAVEAAGAINTAKKPLKYKRTTVKIIVEESPMGLKFVNEDLEFEFHPKNPYDCLDEFMDKVRDTINNFYDNIAFETKKSNFKRKYSLIKKIEENSKNFDFVIVQK